jgi:hypothetical protein
LFRSLKFVSTKIPDHPKLVLLTIAKESLNQIFHQDVSFQNE